MAKKAKKELTLQEKLENALVADWEQPYAVPENWVWTRLGEVFNFENGFAFKSTDYHNSGTPLLRIANIQDNSIDFSECVYIKRKVDERFFVNQGDLLIALSGATTGKSGIYPFESPAYLNQRIGNIKIKIKDTVSLHFRNFFIREKTATILEKAYGGAQPNISPKDLDQLYFPLPPLAEQERIVERIESLFDKLDTAKELLEEALANFESRKSALLHQAFTGELTKNWREKNNVGMNSWKEKKIETMSDLITKGASPRWQGIEYTSDKKQTLFVTSENVRENFLDFTKEKYLDNKINSIQKRSVLKKGDVLLNIVGASIGRSAVFDLDVLANTNQAVAIIRTNKQVSNVFLSTYLNSPEAQRYYTDTKVDVARANISLGDIKEMLLHLPSQPEQKEIVRILDAQLQKEEEAKTATTQSLKQIEHMKKAILARAFRGELGTNNPKDENALELLKEILEKSDTEPKKTKASPSFKIPKEIKHHINTTLEKNIYKTIAQEQRIPLTKLLTLASNSLDIIKALNKMEKNNIIFKTQDSIYSLRS